MAKFFGKVGYAESVDQGSGVWVSDQIVERYYYGDVVKNNRRLENIGQVNDNVAINNVVSIMADAYATQKIDAIRYVEWMGVLWRVINVEVQRPRLLLTLGDVYNGPSNTTP